MFFTVALFLFFAFSRLLLWSFLQDLQFSFGMFSVPYLLLRCFPRTFSSNGQCCFRFLISQGKAIFLMRIFGGNFELYQFFVGNFEPTSLHFQFSASYFLPSFRLSPIHVQVFEFILFLSKWLPSVFGFASPIISLQFRQGFLDQGPSEMKPSPLGC